LENESLERVESSRADNGCRVQKVTIGEVLHLRRGTAHRRVCGTARRRMTPVGNRAQGTKGPAGSAQMGNNGPRRPYIRPQSASND